MKEIFESIFVSFKERFQNRFIGTFLVVFLVLNWKRELALFFLKEMKYADAISVLSMDDSYFYCLIARSALYTLIYLVVSPWISYLVQLLQSVPINRYKRKNISNSMEIIMEKETLEKKKKDVLELAHKNLIVESSRSDEIIFDRLKGAYNEQALVRLLDKINNKASLRIEEVNQLQNYIIECDVVDNNFSSEILKTKQHTSIASLKKLFAFICEHYGAYDGESEYILRSKLDLEMAKNIGTDVLSCYRDFRAYKFKI